MNSPNETSSVVNEIEAWLECLRNIGRSQRTIQTYRDALANLHRYLSARYPILAPVDIRPIHLEEWRNHLDEARYTSACINLYVRGVQYWFEWQMKTDRLFLNPSVGLGRPVPSRIPGRCPSIEDVRRLLNSVNGTDRISLRDRALLEVAYATGARCEEIEGMEITDLDLKRRIMNLLGKGQKERVVPLTTSAVDSLHLYLGTSRPALLRGVEDQPALFLCQRSGRKMETYAIAGVVTRRGAAIGLTISPHDLRRAVATHLLLRGASLAHIRDLLGHADFSHLRAYLKVAPSEVIAMVQDSPLGQ